MSSTITAPRPRLAGRSARSASSTRSARRGRRVAKPTPASGRGHLAEQAYAAELGRHGIHVNAVEAATDHVSQCMLI